MPKSKAQKLYLVDASVLPTVYKKVVDAKELIETGSVRTVAEAVERAGISRSAYYKYKDSVSAFHDLKRGSIMTFHAMLRDVSGVLSSLLAIFADIGANILTINQSIPINGTAALTITAETDSMRVSADELITLAESLNGLISFSVLAG